MTRSGKGPDLQAEKRDSRSARLRESLDHPVIDGDGHTQEYHPLLVEYIREEGGPALAERYLKARLGRQSWQRLSEEERYDRQARRPPFWTMPARNTLDLATAMLPALFRARMDAMGIDYAVVYSSQFFFATHRDEEIRRLGCRALNRMNAEMFRPHADRMTVAAVIPTWTPEEALSELDYAVGTLGLKAIQLTNLNFRPIPALDRAAPDLAGLAPWVDPLALDSAHDYDPVWARCVDLKVAPTAHVGGQGWGPRRSISNYVYNHLGAFAMANEAFCKALFLGGVTRRFPTLNFGFLEGGVHWAAALYNDMIEHWEKRSLEALRANLDPRLIDRDLLAGLAETYGGEAYRAFVDSLRQGPGKDTTGARPDFNPEPEAFLDDFAAAAITSVQDIHDLFVPRFFFGCEADDRMIATAFDTRLHHGGARLGAMFSSDVSHWDVPDMTETLAEAHELVDEGLLTDEDFKDFTFANMVRLHGEVNPSFFKGTVVEAEAERILRSG